MKYRRQRKYNLFHAPISTQKRIVLPNIIVNKKNTKWHLSGHNTTKFKRMKMRYIYLMYCDALMRKETKLRVVEIIDFAASQVGIKRCVAYRWLDYYKRLVGDDIKPTRKNKI